MRNILILCLLLAGCKKRDAPDPDLPLNSFTVGGVQYTATRYVPTFYYSLEWVTEASQAAWVTLQFQGVANPIPAGDYPVISEKDTTKNAVWIQCFDPTSAFTRYYGSTGNDHVKLHVSYENGLMAARLPNVWCKEPGKDSVQVSAYLRAFY